MNNYNSTDSIDKFEEKYKPEYNQILLKNVTEHIQPQDIAPVNGWMYETHGEEIEYVKNIAKTTPNRVWTVMDTNDEWFGIITGYHWINRMGYIITENEWTDINEEYEL